ncbi:MULTISPECIES: ABC transporter ATP-binding protein [Candidatus Ichthyocystis]|nr:MULTISPECIES: ABC transporter ATP-binding protein [Ichthyocystis]
MLSEVVVFSNISLSIDKGEQIAVLGASGSGKSTLLQLMGGLLRPSSGTVSWGDEDIWCMSRRKRIMCRNHHIGFIYQFHNLLNEFNALENVAMPLMIRGEKASSAKEQAESWLNKVGLKDRCYHTPQQLSGGERQRAAVARALCGLPSCILADEPTGSLDDKTARDILYLLQKLSTDHDIALVLVSHDLILAQNMSTLYTLENGSLVSGS